jgi:hypothetical protein
MLSIPQEIKTILGLLTNTSSLDSEGLYDYTFTQPKTEINIFTDNSHLVRRKDEVIKLNRLENKKDDELLLEVKFEKL